MANASSWFDAYGDQLLAIGLFTPGTADYNTMQQHAANETIAQYVSGPSGNGITAATALPDSALWGNIYFNSGYVDGLSTNQAAALLMHEVIHMLGPTDTVIQAALFGASSSQVGAESANITQKLLADCFH